MLTGLVLAGMVMCPDTIFAATKVAAAAGTLASVPSAELPSRVLSEVRAAKVADREVVTVRVVKEAVTVNPAASPAIVGGVSKGFPGVAALAAGTAARQHPKLAADIAKAAATAAPEQAGNIAVAVCKAAPSNYRSIAVAVSKAAPKASRDILKALASAFPELNGGIEVALASYGGKAPSVPAVMESVKPEILLASEGPGTGLGSAPRGPTLAPPYIPTSVSGTNVTPATSGTVPRGGRDYAKP